MGEQKRILYVSDSSDLDLGGQVSLFNLIKRLDRSRYQPVAICPNPGPLVEHLEDVGCAVHLLDSSFFRLSTLWRLATLRWLYGFWKIITRERVDMVHTDRPVTTFLAGLVCLFRGIPLVWHARVSSSDPVLDRLNPFLVNRIIGVSRAVGDRFGVRSGRTPKYRTIYNGVDCEKFHPGLSGQSFREEIGLARDICLVGTIAQLVPQKGMEEFLAASRQVLDKTDAVRFVIVGTGEPGYEQKLRALVPEEDQDKRVLFTGYRKDIPTVLAAMDILVLASWMEGLPRAVIEAMACGKPVIGTSVGGIPEAIEHATTGILVPVQSPEALVASILSLSQDKAARQRMGRAGRERCEALFNIIDHVHAVEKLYDEIEVAPQSVRRRFRQAFKNLYLRCRSACLHLLSTMLRPKKKNDRPHHPDTILIVSQQRLGDAALATPLLDALGRRFHGAAIHVLANDYVASLFEMVPDLGSILPGPQEKGWWRIRGFFRALKAIRKLKPELLVDLNTDGNLQTALMARFARAGFTAGYDQYGRGVFFDQPVAFPEKAMHFVDLLMYLLSPWGINLAHECRLFIPDREREEAKKWIAKMDLHGREARIGIHPGAHHPTQRWPLASFAELADRILAAGTGRIVLFGGPHEWHQVLQIHEMMREPPILAPPSLSLKDLAARLSVMDLVVCNNSGPLHLAAAVGTPTVSFMGPTNAVQWWPFGENHTVFRRDDLPCIGCNSGSCRIGTHDCMERISPDAVFDAIQVKLARFTSETEKALPVSEQFSVKE